MKNMAELREVLANTLKDLRSGAIKPKEASEVANLAGKMNATAIAQLKYYTLRKETPVISFLEEPRP